MKNDFKYIIKKILIGVGIILCLSFINSCEVKAKTMDSFELSQTDYLMTNGSNVVNVPAGYAKFYNYGAGKVLFNFYLPGGTTYRYQAIIQAKIVYSNGFVTGCNLTEGYALSYTNAAGETFGGFIYNAECEVTFNSTSLDYIQLEYRTIKNDSYTSPVLHMAKLVTFVTDTDNNGVIDAIRQYSSLNNTTQILSIIRYFQTQTENQLTDIINLITGEHTTQQQILQQATQQNQKLDEVKDFLTDTSTPSNSDVNNVLNSVNTNNSNVSDLVNLIPSTLQVIVNGFNTGCTGGYNLGNLFGTNLFLPCINPVNYLGSTLWGIIDAILCLCYLIPFSKWLVNTYNDLTSLKNRRMM